MERVTLSRAGRILSSGCIIRVAVWYAPIIASVFQLRDDIVQGTGS